MNHPRRRRPSPRLRLFRARPVVLPVAAGLVLAAAPAVARAQGPAQAGQIIGSIEVRGVRNTNPEVVRAAVAGAGLREGQSFNPAALAEVRRRILEAGLYSDVDIRTASSLERRAVITIEVLEFPVVTEVRIRTNVPLTGRNAIRPEDVLPKLGTQPNLVLNQNTLRADARLVQDIYRRAGWDAYILQIDEDKVFDERTGIVTLPITLTVIEKIDVRGLNKTRAGVVTREMRTKVGEPFNRETVQRDATRIFATNLFANVENPTTDLIEEGRAVLVVPVTEQRTGQVQVGFGYSVQQRLTGTLEIAENNFRGRGQGVSASWTVGGFAARNQFELGFTEPWLDKNNTTLAASLYNRFIFRFNRILSGNATDGQNTNPYFEERRGGSLTLSRPVSEFLRVFATLRTETIRANNLEVNLNRLTQDQVQSLQGALVQNGETQAITFRALQNTRDNERDPASGEFVSPSLEVGTSQFRFDRPVRNPSYISPLKTPGVDPFLSSPRNQNGPFTKYNLDYRRYFTLDKVKERVTVTEPKNVLAARFLIGTATGNIGFAEQYFLGGADDLRGYPDQRYWGNNLFLASMEYRRPLANRGDIVGVLFVDVGDAWAGTDDNRGDIPGFQQRRSFSPRTGYGVGVRIRTPVGPVRLDYGIPTARGEVPRSHFSIGQAF